jgi:uncharacterized protein (DUF924 family)
LDEWFGQLDGAGQAKPEKSRRWWQKDPLFDAYLRRNYASWVERALGAELLEWQSDAASTLALTLLLDQFTRNIYRDTPRMFAGDAAALELSQQAVERGQDTRYPTAQRAFVYLPLMHSESLADQELCVSCFERFVAEVDPSGQGLAQANLRFARAHRDIIQRFGRFPHRNAILGRPSTRAEFEFLTEPGSSF